MSLSQEQIRWGFWNNLHAQKQVPGHITYLEDYTPGETLVLNITQLDEVNSYQQNKIVNRWCERLPELMEVRHLWFVSRVNQRMFDAACRVPNLEALFIKWSGIKSIETLGEAGHLRHLHLGSSS